MGDGGPNPHPPSPIPTCKGRKVAIVNADDPHHGMFLDAAPAGAERLTYAVRSAADVQARDVVSTRDGLRFRVATPWGETELRLKLTGDFNVANTLAALTVGLAEGVPLGLAGSFGMQAARYPEMLDMVAAGKVNPGLLVGDTVALEDTTDVLSSMSSYETLAMSVITGFQP